MILLLIQNIIIPCYVFLSLNEAIKVVLETAVWAGIPATFMEAVYLPFSLTGVEKVNYKFVVN